MAELEDSLRRLEATTDRLDSINSIREMTARYAILLDAVISTPMWYVTHQADGPVGEDRIIWPNRENGRPELADSMETYRRFCDLPTSS
jgi:hypothetical protein